METDPVTIKDVFTKRFKPVYTSLSWSIQPVIRNKEDVKDVFCETVFNAFKIFRFATTGIFLF